MRPPTVCVNRTQPSPSFRLGLDRRELDGGKGDLLRLELGPVADQASARLAVVDDLVVVDLDPGAKLVGLAEGILAAKLVEVGNDVRRRCVVVRNCELEWDDADTVERLERQPRDRRCGGVDAHRAKQYGRRHGMDTTRSPSRRPHVVTHRIR